MGWRGAVRTINAGIGAVERGEQDDPAHEAEQREFAKFEERGSAQDTVRAFDEYLTTLVTFHHAIPDTVDWKALAERPRPADPKPTTAFADLAQEELDRFVPSLTDKLLKRTDKRRRALEAAIEQAKRDDTEAYQEAVRKHPGVVTEWEADREFAQRMLLGDRDAYAEVTKESTPFEGLSNWISVTNVEYGDQGCLNALLMLHDTDVVPAKDYSLRRRGRLTKKRMATIRRHRIYQDHVCSCVLRAAGELLARLPADEVVVTAQVRMLNTAKGGFEATPVLSVRIPRATIATMSFAGIDPSESLRNFEHSMNFKRRTGFQPVTPIALEAP